MIEIKTGDIPCCLYLSDVNEHEVIKSKFLEFINKNSINSVLTTSGDEIYNTDYFVQQHPSTNNSYLDIIKDPLNNHNDALYKHLKYDHLPICTVWFQQYKKGNRHMWHRHRNCIFSNVYYIDMPENASRTTFRFLGREFDVDVKEGQIITFPSFLEHCSKPSKSDGIKTVIGFNSS